MSRLISVWSNTKKSGKTLFLYNFVRELSTLLEPEIKILVIDLNFKFGNILKMFNVQNDLHFEDVLNYKLLSEGSIDYKKAIYHKKNLYFLDSVMPDMSYAKSNLQKYADTMGELKEIFDMVFVDTISGNDNPLTNIILANTDSIINIINQDIDNLNSGFKQKNDIFYVINNYNQDVYPDQKEIRDKYDLQKDIFKLPYCPVLQEMKNRELMASYGEGSDYIVQIKLMAVSFANRFSFPQSAIDNNKKKKLLKFLGG
jgi:MinD-like ATPase involved in chromosome partitioning or flagellar assembly